MKKRKSRKDSHFYIWKMRIEKHIQKQLSITTFLDDLPDERYRHWFEKTNISPIQMANYIITINQFHLSTQ